MTKTLKITAQPCNGTYEIAEDGKITHIQQAWDREIRVTVARNTKRHRAVMAALEAA